MTVRAIAQHIHITAGRPDRAVEERYIIRNAARIVKRVIDFLDIQMPPEGKSRNHSLSDELCLAGKCFRWRIGKMGEITHMIPVYSKAGTVRTEHRIGSIL